MNALRSSARLVATTLICALEIAAAVAAGPYDGEWAGKMAPTSGRCRNPSAVMVTIANNAVSGVWKNEANEDSASLTTHGEVVGVVKQDGTFNGGVVFGKLGTAKLAGKFAGSSFKGDVAGRSCAWEMTLERAR
jgi:hypothetical protein